MHMKVDLEKYKDEMQQELKNILSYWVTYTVDLKNGGFFGKVDNDNTVDEKASKGSVLNSRILWAFSVGYTVTSNPEHLHLARIAFNYFTINETEIIFLCHCFLLIQLLVFH